MDAKEVTKLRKEGKLDEALIMVEQLLADAPTDIWNQRAAAWVYYGYLKQNANPQAYVSFKENLCKIKALQLPENESMIFDNCAWQIGSLVFAIQKDAPVDYQKINELFEIIHDFHFTKPAEAYTFLYKAFHKTYLNWSKYLDFADWWGFDNFRPEDYLKEEFKGKKIIAIAEQAYNAYSKKLLAGAASDPFVPQRGIDKGKIQNFIPQLDQIIEHHPDYLYPPYYKAKMLLALGEDDAGLKSFLPFAKQKRNDFWVWELLADNFAHDLETKFACYCKALSLNTPEDFLVKTRQAFAALLINKKMYAEAKTEIQKVIKTRSKHEWKMSGELNHWASQEWYNMTNAKADNKALYLKFIAKADEILFHDIPEEVVVVEFVNRNKDIINFVKNKRKFGFFKYSGLLVKPQIGDILKVRFNDGGKDGFFKLLTAKMSDENNDMEALKQFENTLKVIAPHNFGFVEDVFVEPSLITESNLVNGQHVKGKAMLSFNKKKNEWGWKAIEIHK